MTALPMNASRVRPTIELPFTSLALGLAVLCPPAAATPQEGAAEFAYTGTALTVYLEARDRPGSIDLRDGPTGRVRVTDATGEGDPVFLLHGDRLLIVHRSDQPARYRLQVPPEAAVSISLAGRRLATLAAGTADRRLSWRWPVGRLAEVGEERPPAPAEPSRAARCAPRALAAAPRPTTPPRPGLL